MNAIINAIIIINSVFYKDFFPTVMWHLKVKSYPNRYIYDLTTKKNCHF